MIVSTRRSPVTRRVFLAGVAAVALLGVAGLQPAVAQGGGADAFVKQFADQLVAVVNGPGSTAEKQASLRPLIDNSVDVAAIARFCLGRFWNTATPSQQAAYTQLFHQVLLNNISGHLGEYKGVTYSMTGTRSQGADALVGTVINRPNAPPANVQWVVRMTGEPKVLDVVAEGTSLRLTQRQDYTSYLTRHANNIDALIAALKRQLNS